MRTKTRRKQRHSTPEHARDKVLVYDLEDRGDGGRPPYYAREPTVFADGLAIPLGLAALQGWMLRATRP